MIIKKHKTGNEYVLTAQNIWVRNPANHFARSLDINHLVEERDCHLFLENEAHHRSLGLNEVDFETRNNPNVVIVSDGYKFEEEQSQLEKFKDNVIVIGVNGSLAKWKYADKSERYKRAMNWYLANNPYPECKRFLPKHKYYPSCMVAARTNTDFVKDYKGKRYIYSPVRDRLYAGLVNFSGIFIDDYRNPICAAIGAALALKAKKILLFCCDDSFEDERPGSVQLENGLWTYPQHLVTFGIIDALAWWLKKAEISILDHSSGMKYKQIPYIAVDQAIDFFDED
jgi:hypothetical protein